MQKMICSVCGHIYDPAKGDPGAPAGTAFEDVAEGWQCPVCGAPKNKFSPKD